MLKDTELKLYGSIGILESVLNSMCRRPDPGKTYDDVLRAKELVREAILHERKVIDGN